MKSKLNVVIIGVVILVLLIGLGFLFSMLFGEKSNQSVTLPDHKFEDWNQKYDFQQDGSGQSISLFDEKVEMSYEQLIEMARTGKISLVSELWRMRRKCPPEMDRFQCNSLLREFIMQKFPEPGNKKLADILVKYLKYEEEMAEYYIPGDLSLEERYNKIRQKRKDFFGEDDASLIFGLEEAKYDFSESLKEFKKNTADLKGDAKIAAYEELKKRAYGDYYDAVVAREPAFVKYETEMELRDQDFQELNETGKSLLTRELRVKYFGKEASQRMEKVDGFLAKEKEAEEELSKAEAEFNKNNPELTPEQRESKLKELRIKYLGNKEAAEAWGRRQKLKQGNPSN